MFLGKKFEAEVFGFPRYCNVEKYCFKQLVLTAFFISFEAIFPSCLQDSYHCKNHRSTVDTCITFVVWYCNTVTDKAQNMLQNFYLCISRALIFWFFLSLALKLSTKMSSNDYFWTKWQSFLYKTVIFLSILILKEKSCHLMTF